MSYLGLSLAISAALLLALGAESPPAQERAEAAEPLDGVDGRPLDVRLFLPRPMLVAGNDPPAAAKFPAVDVHVHPKYKLQRRGGSLDDYVAQMDRQNVALAVSLDGGWGADLEEHLAYLRPHAERFVVFANVDWQGSGAADDPASWDCQRPDFGRLAVERLRKAARLGAAGLKIFKSLGLEYRDADGELLKIDDPRWDPIWSACGELGLPVIMHTADPAAFFEPIDRYNERWTELQRYPDWSFHGDEFPRREDLLAARNRVIARHPNTTFIGAHFGGAPEDLATVGAWLDQYPNLVVEISARISELGRQPYSARRFFLKYSDRILFGTDGPRGDERVRRHWQFLETDDEYFPYAEAGVLPPKGLWNIYGLHLPDDVLRRVYHENAARIIPRVATKLERRTEAAASN